MVQPNAQGVTLITRTALLVMVTTLVVGVTSAWLVSDHHDYLLTARFWLAISGLCVMTTAVAVSQFQRVMQHLTQVRVRVGQLLNTEDSADSEWPILPGEIGELVRVIRQVTVAREQAAHAQSKMLGQLEAILKNASVGILFTRDGRFELVGHHFCSLLGYTEQELQGQLTRVIYPSDEAFAELGQRVREAFSKAAYFDGEVVLKRKDGSEFWSHMLGRGVVLGDPSAGTIWIVDDITEARKTREQLSWTATHDSLTELVNRREYESRLGAVLRQPDPGDICVMFLDLDRFKIINDTAGHAAGDEALRQIARLLEHEVRQSDTVSRLGGDEFAVLLMGCPLPRAQHIAEQMRAKVTSWQLTFEGQVFGLGASIGIAQVGPSLNRLEDLIQAADSACYQAKRQGRNQVVTFTSPDKVDA